MLRFDVDSWKISTHTLARRVTAEEFQAYVWDEISTHTLARRVTPTSIIIRHVAYISTHTLARRVTELWMQSQKRIHNFNPHPRTEGDLMLCSIDVWDIFQPTPSHGG